MKEKTPDVDIRMKSVPIAGTNEIDLLELLVVLWRQKILILLVTGIFTLVGAAYAFLSPQVWSASAVITLPEQKDLVPMLQVAGQAKLLGIEEFPDGKQLYDEFINKFNSYDNRHDFLKNSDFFNSQKISQLDDRTQRLWIRQWANTIVADSIDKKGEKPGVKLAMSANTPDQALTLLENYIQFVITKQQQKVATTLADQRSIQLDALTTQLKLSKEDAERSLKNEIKNTALATSIAKAAGIEQPLQNYNAPERFNITLGIKGLDEKLQVLQNMSTSFYNPKIVDLQIQRERLQQINLDGIRFRPFSFLNTPEEALSRDKPKRLLIVVITTLLGGLLGGSIVLLRHTFRRPEKGEYTQVQ